MIIEVQPALDRNDVVGVLVLLFDFKQLREDSLSTYYVEAILTR